MCNLCRHVWFLHAWPHNYSIVLLKYILELSKAKQDPLQVLYTDRNNALLFRMGPSEIVIHSSIHSDDIIGKCNCM